LLENYLINIWDCARASSGVGTGIPLSQ